MPGRFVYLVVLGLVVAAVDMPARCEEPKLPYFPIQPSNKWEFENPRANPGYVTRTYEFAARLTEYKTKAACVLTKRYAENHTQSELIFADDQSVYVAGGIGRDDQMYYYHEPRCILKAKSDRAQIWKWKMQVVGKDGKPEGPPMHYVLTQVNEKITLNGEIVEAIAVTMEDDFEASGGFGAAGGTKTWYVAGRGPVQLSHTDKKDLVWALKKFSGDADISVTNFQWEKDLVEVEASAEEVEAPPGVVTEFKKSRTIKREVRLGAKLGVEAEVEAKLRAGFVAVKGEVSARAKASLQVEIGESLTDTETREQSIKIDGDKLPAAKIVWIDLHRRGTMTVTHDGKTYSVPFEFPYGTKLVVRKR